MQTKSHKLKGAVSHYDDTFVGPPAPPSLDSSTSTSGGSNSGKWIDLLSTTVTSVTSLLSAKWSDDNSAAPVVVQPQATASQPNNTAMYAGLGVGALVLILILLVVLKK